MEHLFLALADIHGSIDALEQILRANPNIEGILVAGDLTNFGKENEAHKVLSAFSTIVPEAKLYFLAGNCDTAEARRCFEKRLGYIEQRCYALLSEKDIWIIGCGGGLFHTGLTPFEIREEELENGLSQAYKCAIQGYRDIIDSSEFVPDLIVLTHTPPKDTFADMRHSRHIGSVAFQTFLYEHEPLLWVCGHIHEGKSIHIEDRTLVVNPGPAAHGSYALILLKRYPKGWKAAAELRSI
ncbi:MAG: Calcineurin-like phosphoesterase superfamily domain protein [Spirochaetes bacterium ADurb.Bin110]|nr:MAG: Calcineurin-like phosphoesterase superfamily domain protein [Spirochaetes bacterium ADurb.Bin110]